MVNELICNSKLYNKNSPKFIINFFKLGPSCDIFHVNRDLVYKFNYLEKKKKILENEKLVNDGLTSSEKKKKRYSKYLDCSKKESKLLTSRPEQYNDKNYRKITLFNDEYLWIKKFQKKFHNEIVKSLPSSELPYLQSTIKHVSYASNANAHKGKRYAFIIDMENFFTQVNDDKVKMTLKKLLSLDNDIAEIYTKLLTSPCDEPPYHNNHYVIGQGLPSSPLMAFLCNSSFFDYLNQSCMAQDIKMTIYVDDIVFSSEKPISQEFIDRLFTLFKKNDLSINRKKCALVKNDGIKKITGAFVTPYEVRVKNSKREEINIIYNKIIEIIKNLNDFKSYFDLYNLFLKFTGNFYHLAEVECKTNGKYSIPLQYSKYYHLIKLIECYIPRGINKKNSKEIYNQENIRKDEDMQKLNSAYQKLLFNKERICNNLERKNDK